MLRRSSLCCSNKTFWKLIVSTDVFEKTSLKDHECCSACNSLRLLGTYIAADVAHNDCG